MLGNHRPGVIVAVSAILGAAIALPLTAFAADVSARADSTSGSRPSDTVGPDLGPDVAPMMSGMMGPGDEGVAPGGPAMSRMHGQMMRENPGMARLHREMMRDQPMMRRAHKEMMDRHFAAMGTSLVPVAAGNARCSAAVASCG